MNKKLIFLDIDGTLLPGGSLCAPASAVDAIRRARAAGHMVFLCTGRNLCMTAPLFEYGFDGYICSAGGYVCCGQTVLADIPMEQSQLDGLRAVFDASGVDYTLEARDATYGCTQMIERFANNFKLASALNSEAARWVEAMKSGMTVHPLDEYRGEPVYKIVYFAPNAAALMEPRRQYEDQFVFCQSYIERDNVDGVVNGELINRKFDKGTGIKAICAHLGRDIADTIGFGDSDNDLQMAETVGLSVCMANGSDSLKKLCDRVCPAVDDNGIAKEFAALGLI